MTQGKPILKCVSEIKMLNRFHDYACIVSFSFCVLIKKKKKIHSKNKNNVLTLFRRLEFTSLF